MSAINEITILMEKISVAMAEITSMQARLPALIEAAKEEELQTKSAKPERTKPKKPVSDGTMAWQAFVSHVQEQQPSRFADMKKRNSISAEAKVIRQEDEHAYNTFISSWRSEHLSSVESVDEIKEKEKEKKKAAIGTMAWHAFVKHCKMTMPNLESLSKREKMPAIKAHKENDKAGYESFVAEWKAAQHA